MSQRDPVSTGGLVLSHVGVRRGIGLLGLALPVVLVLGTISLDGRGIQGSISGYYYTAMRDYFVGTNCAMGVLLASYRYRRLDCYLSSALAVFTVGIALIPTAPAGGSHTTGQLIAGQIHLICATLFFLGMAYFSFALFTRTDPTLTPTPRKRARNVAYRVCGTAILACLVLVFVTNLVLTDQLKNQLHPTFWLESVAVWAFSVSWLIKGEFLFLKD